MTYAVNARTNANRAFERLLSAVQNIVPKEVSKTHPTATILTIRDKVRNYTYSKIKRLTEEKIRKIRTIFIQKKCGWRSDVKFKKVTQKAAPYNYINKYIFSLPAGKEITD